MLNAEKFKEDILKVDGTLALVHGKPAKCADTKCNKCDFHISGISCRSIELKWLLSEYEPPKIEPEVYQLKMDDKVEVSINGKRWFKRHFKCIEDNLVVVWNNGKTSFSADNKNSVAEWEYARIPREE